MNSIRINVARCCANVSCKCGSITNPLVIRKKNVCSLYCYECGRYIKTTNTEDRKNIYPSFVICDTKMDAKLVNKYLESERTMF